MRECNWRLPVLVGVAEQIMHLRVPGKRRVDPKNCIRFGCKKMQLREEWAERRNEVDHRRNSSDTRHDLIFTRNRSANAAQRRGSSENKYPGKELVQRTVNPKEMQFRLKIIPARDPNSVVGTKG